MKQEMILYALKDNVLVHIDSVKNGKECGCICPGCQRPLVARNQGTKNAHSFAHSSSKDAFSCEYGRESTLHYMTKNLIEKGVPVLLPSYAWSLSDIPHRLKKSIQIAKIFDPEEKSFYELVPSEKVYPEEVVLEKRLHNIIPDVLINHKGKQVAIEIFVTHRVDADKVQRIAQEGISTIEIDLSKEPHNLTSEQLKLIIAERLNDRRWIYCTEGNNIKNQLINNLWKEKDNEFPYPGRQYLIRHVNNEPYVIMPPCCKKYSQSQNVFFVEQYQCNSCDYCAGTHTNRDLAQSYIFCTRKPTVLNASFLHSILKTVADQIEFEIPPSKNEWIFWTNSAITKLLEISSNCYMIPTSFDKNELSQSVGEMLWNDNSKKRSAFFSKPHRHGLFLYALRDEYHMIAAYSKKAETIAGSCPSCHAQMELIETEFGKFFFHKDPVCNYIYENLVTKFLSGALKKVKKLTLPPFCMKNYIPAKKELPSSYHDLSIVPTREISDFEVFLHECNRYPLVKIQTKSESFILLLSAKMELVPIIRKQNPKSSILVFHYNKTFTPDTPSDITNLLENAEKKQWLFYPEGVNQASKELQKIKTNLARLASRIYQETPYSEDAITLASFSNNTQILENNSTKTCFSETVNQTPREQERMKAKEFYQGESFFDKVSNKSFDAIANFLNTHPVISEEKLHSILKGIIFRETIDCSSSNKEILVSQLEIKTFEAVFAQFKERIIRE